MNTTHIDSRDLNLPPVVGLLDSIPEPGVEHLAITVIKRYHDLMKNAEELYRGLPPKV